MEKEWTLNYPKGVPPEINVEEYSSAVDVFMKAFAQFKNKAAFANMGKTLTFAEIDRLSMNFAAYLQKVVGLKKGDRIAIQMPNLLQYPIVMFGAMRAGLIVVNTNPLYTAREMEHQFKDSGAKAVVILANYANLLQQVLPKTSIETVIVTEVGDMLGFPKSLIVNAVVKHIKKMIPDYHLPKAVKFTDALSWGAAHKFDYVDISLNDLAFLQYTGGTTGVSKGVMLSHRNIVANMQQVSAWISPALEENEIIVTPLPLYHIFSLTVNCLCFMKFGGLNVLITNPRDLPAVIKDLKKYKFTMLTAVNTLFNALARYEPFKQLDLSHLKLSVGGGMAVQKPVSDMWEQITGHPILEGYGLTESAPVICCNPVGEGVKVGTIGLPVPSTLVKICDENGKEVPKGQPGELLAYGPQIMQGYWQRPDETAKVLTPDGWLKTGDMAVALDGGYFKIVDRIKDMILVSGFNVYPNEVEEVVAMHPGVLEVAAVGVADEKSGEVVKIFVVKKDLALSAEDLQKHCKTNLTGYKQPKYIEFRTELPKTNVGKILRRALKEPVKGADTSANP